MTLRRRIKSKYFLKDVQSGMTPRELMKKYGLSSGAFTKVLKSIIDFRLRGREAKVEFQERRGRPRTVITYPLWIYDRIDQVEDGRILDLSEKGVRIAGLTVMVGEARTFIVRFRRGEEREPFAFDAVCRWVAENGTSSSESVAGFEITDISQEDFAALSDLINDAT